jgi:hypothetical protein
MATTIDATFDGRVFHPSGPVPLEPNTVVRLTVEPIPAAPHADQPPSFLRTARSLNVQGPPDWASKLDEYLDGEGGPGAD